MASAILDAIFRVAKNPHEAMALAYACGAESNCESIQNLAGAPAWGPWQIYLPIHNTVSIAQANDPAYAAQYMYQHRDVTGCTAQQGDLWNSDPSVAALNAARCIEGATSAEPYSAAQQQNGVAWMQQAATYPAAKPSTPIISGLCSSPFAVAILGPAYPTICGINAVQQGNLNPVQGIQQGASQIGSTLDFLSKVQTLLSSHTFWIRALLTVGGLGAVLMGIKGLAGIEAMPVPVPV